ncbi:hypothetical protein ABBQ32_000255 [Trebouxia sp. C0010 RCD-2024]
MWCLPANSGLHLATSLQPGLTRSNNAPSPGPLKPSAVRFLLCGTTCKSTQHSRSAQRAVSSRKGAGKVQETLQRVPGNPYQSLQSADKTWHQLCNTDPRQASARTVVTEHKTPLPQTADLTSTQDVVVLGGTLGIFLATALLLRGKSVTVVERNALLGRDQEWNISKADMQVFVEVGVLTAAEVEEVLVTEFNPVRIAIGDTEIMTQDVLNCGVHPKPLLEIVKQRFLAAGGTLLEGAAFQEARVHSDGVEISVAVRARGEQRAGGAGGAGAQLQVSAAADGADMVTKMRCKLMVDAMGAFSPIAAQSRKGAKPDSVVLMVGSCAEGLPPCTHADLLYSVTPIDRERQLQLFWEVFPARDGQTTYMFAYTDPTPGRLSLEDMFAEYLRLLPEYRSCENLDGVSMKRAFFGFVPNWEDSPLKACTSRLVHIGDASGNRSALSFAGFGAIARHLRRLTNGLEGALDAGVFSKQALQLLQPHSPAISITAAMQQSMGTRAGQSFKDIDDQIINKYIGASFAEMKVMGEEVYKPFMQDYMQANSLLRIVGTQLIKSPGLLVGMTNFMQSPKAGALFATSFSGILWYDLMFKVCKYVDPLPRRLLKSRPKMLWRWDRMCEAFEYGSANDIKQ